MMLPSHCDIFVATDPTDFRRSYDGLCGVVRAVLGREPSSGALFVFRNRRGDQVKLLFRDRNGFVIWMKRLDRGTFRFPSRSGNDSSRRFSMAELALLLEEGGGSAPRLSGSE
jgi:transposase